MLLSTAWLRGRVLAVRYLCSSTWRATGGVGAHDSATRKRILGMDDMHEAGAKGPLHALALGMWRLGKVYG